MKKLLSKTLLLVLPFLFMQNVHAASATIAVSSSANQIIVGNNVVVYVTISSASPLGSWEYTLNYDNSVFKLVSSDVDLHYASYASNDNTKSVTYKYTFTALRSGSSKFYIDSSAVIGWDESYYSTTDGSKVVSAITYAEYQASLSTNNNLDRIEIDGYEITPEFDKDTLEYSVKVNEDETLINVAAYAEDYRATVTGDGEIEVSAGNNVVNIVVIAQNGSEKTYKLTIEVIDKDPIEVKIDNKNYTVVKIASNLTKPKSYVEKTITIDEKEIPAFYSEITEYTLVGLKDEKGEIGLYIYEDGKYTKYIELSFGNITIYPLPMNEKMNNYQKYNIKIQKNDIECLATNSSSRYKLIYGMNVETKEKGLFIYDSKDNTIMKYDADSFAVINDKLKKVTYVAIAFGVTTFVSLITLIIASSKKKGNKKIEKVDNKPKEKDKNKEVEAKEEQEEVYDIFADDHKKKKKKK
ncbi:MAG: cadherin-like beta sandwich domain-containing protein [Bacilli bacterium]|nr:cadherin-like beta sandwich domain-containing protein [Bacilli bacterium]